jgi:2-polyprenyl-3-methyl-5-hydroxy-6-metoxy-1,4-benzoquinol methylase
VDCSPSDLEIARRHAPGIEFIQSNIVDALRQNPGRFDLLHAKDVVEHLTPDELIEFLDACNAALKSGGQLWILTYNAQSPFANATRYGDFTHEIGLTPSSMAQVLSATGFHIDHIVGTHVCPETFSGRLRRAVWAAATPFFRLLLKARHGRGPEMQGVDLLATHPDLFATARKRTGESN